MLPTTVLVFSASLAMASAQSSSCTPHSASTGFRLVINVTDSLLDLSPPIHGQYLSTAHIGPGQNRAVAASSQNLSPILYQNSTFQAQLQHRAGILTDTGSGLVEALTYLPLPDPSQGANGVFISIGESGAGTALTRLWTPQSYLTILSGVIASSFVGCNSTIPYYGPERQFQVLNWVAATRDSTGTHVRIPEGCVPINLVPECAFLPVPVEGAVAGHEFVQEVRCYENVGTVAW